MHANIGRHTFWSKPVSGSNKPRGPFQNAIFSHLDRIHMSQRDDQLCKIPYKHTTTYEPQFLCWYYVQYALLTLCVYMCLCLVVNGSYLVHSTFIHSTVGLMWSSSKNSKLNRKRGQNQFYSHAFGWTHFTFLQGYQMIWQCS